MPGAPAYPGGLPQETADGRILFCLRERGCTHLWSVAADGSDARAVLDGAGRVVVRALRRRRPRGGRPRHAHVVRRDRGGRPDRRPPRPCVTEHGAGLADVELFERVERTFTISDGTEVQAWLVRDPERDGTAAPPGRHPRRPAQRVERRGRRDPPLPPGARRARLGDPARQPARQRRLRRGVLRRASTARGASRTPTTSSSRSTSSSPRGSPTRSGWRSPATATAAS